MSAETDQTIDLSIIIVSYNSESEILDCLKSIDEKVGALSHEVIVVDNASADRTQEIVEQKRPAVHLIKNPDNVGFGPANNLGLAQAKGTYVLFLNPDTVIDTGTLADLVTLATSLPSFGLLAPKLVSSDGTLQRSIHRRFPGWLSHIVQYNFLLFTVIQRLSPGYDYTLSGPKEHSYQHEILHAMGAAILIPHDVLKEVGGFDDRFFLYFEETELCLRVHKAGYKLYFTPKVVVEHRMGASSGERQFGQASVYYQESAYLYFAMTRGKAYTHLLKTITTLGLWSNYLFLAVYNRVMSRRSDPERGQTARAGYTFTKRALVWHRTHRVAK
jgi:GT2 family glycosyltransferase